MRLRFLLIWLLLIASSSDSKSGEKAWDDVVLGGNNRVKSGGKFSFNSGSILDYQGGSSIIGDLVEFRSDLGLAIGTNVQAYGENLQALRGLTGAADKLPYFTAAGTMDVATFTAQARTLMTAVDTTAQQSALGLTIGGSVQAHSSILDAIAADDYTANINVKQVVAVNNSSIPITAGRSTDGRCLQIVQTASGALSFTQPMLELINENGTYVKYISFSTDAIGEVFYVLRSGEVHTSGAVYSPLFSGSGSALTNLNADNLASGTVLAARMPAFSGAITTPLGSTVTTLAAASTSATSFSTQTFYSTRSGGGTQSLPIYTTAADPDTGEYSSGTDEWAITTGAGRRVRFSGTGTAVTNGASGLAEFEAAIRAPIGSSTVPGVQFGSASYGIYQGSSALNFKTPSGTISFGTTVGFGGLSLTNIAGITATGGITSTSIGSPSGTFTVSSVTNMNLTAQSGNGLVIVGGTAYLDGPLSLKDNTSYPTDAHIGTSTLVAGTVTVTTSKVTANSKIFVSRKAKNASVGLGVLEGGTITPATSFVINSYDLTGSVETDDVSSVDWMIVEGH